MTGADLLKMTAHLEQYLTSFDGLFGRFESREHFRCFVRGQLGTLAAYNVVILPVESPSRAKSLTPILSARLNSRLLIGKPPLRL